MGLRTNQAEIFVSYRRRDNHRDSLPAAIKHASTKDYSGWVDWCRCELERRISNLLVKHQAESSEHDVLARKQLSSEVRSFLDVEDIRAMDQWRARTLNHLREASILLVFSSASYFRSPFCYWEWQEFKRRLAGKLIGLKQVAVLQLAEHDNTDDFLEDEEESSDDRHPELSEQQIQTWREEVNEVQFLTLPSPYDKDALAQAAAVLQQLAEQLCERILRLRRARQRIGNLPHPNRLFVGRMNELQQLRKDLHGGGAGVISALHGLGGQGKTELSLAYGWAYADHYPGGLWRVNGENHRELLPLLAQLADEPPFQLPQDPQQSLEQRGRALLQAMEHYTQRQNEAETTESGSCLIVLDNVDRAELLSIPQLDHLLRESWLHILVTTRLGDDEIRTPSQYLSFLPLDTLGLEDGLLLLRSHQKSGDWPEQTAKEDRVAAKEIVTALGGFALALEQVAVYLGQYPKIRPADFLQRLMSEGLVEIDNLGAEPAVAVQMKHREKQLGLILKSTLASLELDLPLAQHVLDLACLLPREQIPWLWIERVLQESETFPDPRLGYPDVWSTITYRVNSMRLLLDHDLDPLLARMHPLIAVHLQARLCEKKQINLLRELTRVAAESIAAYSVGQQDTFAVGVGISYYLNFVERFLKEGGYRNEYPELLRGLIMARPQTLDHSYNTDKQHLTQVLEQAGMTLKTEQLPQPKANPQGPVWIDHVDGIIIDLPRTMYTLKHSPRFMTLTRRLYPRDPSGHAHPQAQHLLKQMSQRLIEQMESGVRYLMRQRLHGVEPHRFAISTIDDLPQCIQDLRKRLNLN